MAITVTGSTLSVTLSNATDLELGGHLTWTADNTKDVGASGANRPRTGYFATSVVSPLVTNAGTLALSATGANIITAATNGTVRIKVASDGKTGVNVTTPLSSLHVGETGTSSPRGILSAQYSTGTEGARAGFMKARGTEASPTTVVTGDTLGRLMFRGYDSANYLEMASIEAVSTGTIAATRVPTYIAFSTATDAAPSVLTEAMRLTAAQNLLVGTTTDGMTASGSLAVAKDLAHRGTKIGFFNTTPTTKQTALTAADAGVLNTGDATSDTVIGNMRTRIGELETKLQAYGLLA